MRFHSTFIGIVGIFIINGCKETPKDTNDKDEPQEALPDKNLQTTGPKIRHSEKVNIAEGCQSREHVKEYPEALKHVERSACYTVEKSITALPPKVSVTVYFQRSATSKFNEDYHDVGFIAIKSGYVDSFVTNPGVEQALKINKQIIEKSAAGTDKDREILSTGSFENESVVFAVSNLRRSALTFLVSFKHLIKKIKKIHVVSALQELNNISGQTLAEPHSNPKLVFPTKSALKAHPNEPICPFEESQMKKIFDPTCNDGNEKYRPAHYILGVLNPENQIDLLCTWMYNVVVFGEDFAESGNKTPKNFTPTNFILTGHARQLNQFYRKKLDNGAWFHDGNELENKLSSVAIPNKLSNSGMVRFKLDLSYTPANGKINCSIDPNSSALIFGSVILERDD